MKKWKYCSIFIAAFLFVCGGVMLPSVFAKQEKKELFTTHEIESIDFKLDSQASDILLVQRIHQIFSQIYGEGMEESNAVIKLGGSGEEKLSLYSELKELNEKGILLGTDFENLLDYIDYFGVYIISTEIGQSVKEYSIRINEQSLTAWMDVETNKLIYLELSGTGEIAFAANQDEMMRAFISYLNLDVLEDWTGSNDMMQSGKAALVVKNIVSEKEKKYQLAVLPESMLTDVDFDLF